MRKKITCRIIKSAPLNAGGEFRLYKEFSDNKSTTYTNNMRIIDITNDNEQTSKILDFYI